MRELFCTFNKITSLPPLNDILRTLFCYSNKLTSLPFIPYSLKRINCANNQINYLPFLHDDLNIGCVHNPILELFNNENFNNNNKVSKLNILLRFREFYFFTKFRFQFHKWLWKSREKQIIEKYNPQHLNSIIQLNENNPNFILDEFLEKW